MKIIFFPLALSMIYCTINAQQDKRDSILRSVNEHVQSAGSAAETFINRQLPVDVRLKAIAPYSVIYNQEHVAQFKRILTSTDEPPEIRATALSKIYQYVESDDELFNQVLNWFMNPETPRPLRYETLSFIGNISYSSFAGATDAYKKMVRDPDINFRSFAFSKLLRMGDDAAQQMLIRGLEDPQSAPLDPVTSIELLAASPKKDFYPVVYKIFQETKVDSIRLTALRVLGPYQEARQRIIAVSRDPNEKEEFRTSALLALYAGNKENIISNVTPILRDKSATENLQAVGIQIGIDVRRTMAYRRKANKADEFDILIREIAEGRGVVQSRVLQQLANRYLLLVRPVY